MLLRDGQHAHIGVGAVGRFDGQWEHLVLGSGEAEQPTFHQLDQLRNRPR